MKVVRSVLPNLLNLELDSTSWEAGMHRNRSAKRVAFTLTAVLTVTIVLAGCSQKTPIAAPTSPAQSDQVQAVVFDLYTHCGIDNFKAYGKYFARIGGALSDGSGNPPDGWGNPIQRGTLTLSGDTAVFRDKLGHVERFKAEKRPADSRDLCA